MTATVQATGTTGSLLGRHGNLKARGSYDPETDRFTVLISGRLHH